MNIFYFNTWVKKTKRLLVGGFNPLVKLEITIWIHHLVKDSLTTSKPPKRSHENQTHLQTYYLFSDTPTHTHTPTHLTKKTNNHNQKHGNWNNQPTYNTGKVKKNNQKHGKLKESYTKTWGKQKKHIHQKNNFHLPRSWFPSAKCLRLWRFLSTSHWWKWLENSACFMAAQPTPRKSRPYDQGLWKPLGFLNKVEN